MLTRKGKYGLKAMILLAREQGRGPILIGDLAEQEAIPKKFLENILLALKHRGLVQSRKGPHGGYQLDAHPTRSASARSSARSTARSPSCPASARRPTPPAKNA